MPLPLYFENAFARDAHIDRRDENRPKNRAWWTTYLELGFPTAPPPDHRGSAHVASSVAASAAVSRCSAANASSLSSFCFSSEDLAFTLNVLTARTPAPVRATGSSTLPSSSTSSRASLSKSARRRRRRRRRTPRAARRRRARRTPQLSRAPHLQRAANGVRRRGRRVGRGLFRELLELLELLRQRLLLREHGFRLGQSGGVRQFRRQPPRRGPAPPPPGGRAGEGGSAGGASESHRRRLDRRPSAGGDPAPSLGRFSAEPAIDDLVRSTEKRRFSAR